MCHGQSQGHPTVRLSPGSRTFRRLGSGGFLTEARTLLQHASPSRHALQQRANVPDLVGGVTSALDLSQAFDTVSRQEMISLLHSEGADGDTTRLVQALHYKSKYVLKAQRASTSVETTAV